MNLRRSGDVNSLNMGHASNLCVASHRGQFPVAGFFVGADEPSFFAVGFAVVADTFALAAGLL